MKKAVKTLISFLSANREEASARSEKYMKNLEEKTPKAILLACPQSARFLTMDRESLYTVESYGNTVYSNEATLDYAVRRLEIPLLCIMGHAGCSAVDRDAKIANVTDAEKALRDVLAESLKDAPARGEKRSLYAVDRQVAAALERYNDMVKSGKLAVVGLYCDKQGNLFLTNYNGLKGKEALSYSLPEVDPAFFLA